MAYDKSTNTYNGYIYKITNLVNDKIYIGQTIRDIHKRWIGHVNAHKDTAISRAIDKYGKENFKIEELAHVYGEDKDELKRLLNYLEIAIIKETDSLVYNKNGYNISQGGNVTNKQGKKVTLYNIDGKIIKTFNSIDEACLFCDCSSSSVTLCCLGKQSTVFNKYVFRYDGDSFDKYQIKLKPKIYRFDISGSITGIYNSVIEAESATKNEVGHCSSIGKVINNPYLLAGGYWWSNDENFNYKGNSKESPVDQYDINGNLIQSFASIKECSEVLNLQFTNISKVCLGKRHTTGGFVFRYSGDKFDLYDICPNADKMYNKKMVNQYTKNGIYIKTFDSVNDATKEMTNKRSVAISNCCRKVKNYNTAFGYKWYFANDETQPDKSKIIKK